MKKKGRQLTTITPTRGLDKSDGLEDPQREEFEKWIVEKTEKIIESLPTISQKTVRFKFILEQNIGAEEHEMIFSVRFHKEYHQLFINVYRGAFVMYANGEKKDLVNGIIHEIIHVNTKNLYDLASERYVREKELEGACEELTENMSFYARYYLEREYNINK
jgi:hypothetical protein